MHVKHSTDMTVGAIPPLLINFALPLIAGNLFQQLYNTVDSIVVGNYVGAPALAAVGASTPLIRMLVGFFMGLSTGGGVVVSHRYGAKDVLKLRETVHSMILGTLILGISFTFVGILISPAILKMVSTPDEVFVESVVYLRIYFGGILFFMLYNIGAGILRAVGNSSQPFYFLVISSLTNVALDIYFVVVLKIGVAGVAYATVISEALSTFLVLRFLFCTKEIYNIRIKEMHVHWDSIKAVLKVGLPGGIQMSITSFSNVFVQAYINKYGYACMAAWAAYGKVDQLAILPIQSIAMSSTTFVGQNYGAQKKARVKEGIFDAIKIGMTIAIVLGGLLFIFAPKLTMLFSRDPDVIYYGVYFLHSCAPFYSAMCMNQIYAGALRGLGNSATPMIFMLLSFVVFRQLALFVLTHLTDAFWPVAFAFPFGWSLCSILMNLYFIKVRRTVLA